MEMEMITVVTMVEEFAAAAAAAAAERRTVEHVVAVAVEIDGTVMIHPHHHQNRMVDRPMRYLILTAADLVLVVVVNMIMI